MPQTTAFLSTDPDAAATPSDLQARSLRGWARRLRAWLPGHTPYEPFTAPTPHRPVAAAQRLRCDFWPLVAQAAQALQPQQRLCELHGTPPATPLVVRGAASDLQALLAHLSVLSRHVLGATLPRATVRMEAGHAVLHWGEHAPAEQGLQLARLFSRLSATAVAPTPAEAALHHSVHGAQRIAQACGGRLYPSASPLALMRLTARLPLATQEAGA
ncbi:hypothetical protein PGB34_20825 [Xenophilus arseniciresistens]|uniref:Uncharacterized protein n=1 Tax=Xenophilus arseniciresistens TaxID=1283306 RepID=A0AAE3NCD6_9BURK|nr:hypothetical protein [Xenophilus arseniciresistens]MDA7418823.1 hypothetical protein [Xenophilus arseniciresistens]